LAKKPDVTPRTRVRAALRQLWLRSRERAAALKLAGNACKACGVKGTRKKGQEVILNVHHVEGIDWDGVIDLIFERILQDPSMYEVLCKDCHRREHELEKIKELIG